MVYGNVHHYPDIHLMSFSDKADKRLISSEFLIDVKEIGRIITMNSHG